MTDFIFLLVSSSISPAWFLFVAYLSYLILRRRKNAGRAFIFLVLAITSGFVLNGALKEHFRRPRPPEVLQSVVIVGEKSADFSFPSGHAFAAALLSTLFVRKRKAFVILVFYAALVGFSRVFLGAHYPSDVAVGWGFGILYGLSVDHFYERFLESTEHHILKHHL